MEELPPQCNYLSLGAARIREIKSIVSKLKNCEHGGRAFQKLPRHMQRRAVSSNPRRLSRYLREKHMREGGGNTKTTHRPRRRYRRRPSNLLQEYNRRQKEHIWLETHIWHAKRFHMQKHWGYVLPDAPTCRGHRASLRAATTGCLLQDVSYLCCVELSGIKTTVITGLSKVLQTESLSVLTSPQVLSGKQWMSSMFFQPGRQPYGAIGEVEILFHPSEHDTEDEDQIKLWIWTHPSTHTHIVETLGEIFGLEKVYVNGKGDGGEEVLEKEMRGDCEVVGSKKEVSVGDFEAEECKSEVRVDEGKGKGGHSEGISDQDLRDDSEIVETKKEVIFDSEGKGKGDHGEGISDQDLRDDSKTVETKKEVPVDSEGKEINAVLDKEEHDGGEKELRDEESKTPVPDNTKKKKNQSKNIRKRKKGVPEKADQDKDTKKAQKRDRTKKPKNINAEKLKTRNVPFERTPKYASSDSQTTMTLLKDTLNRFRLLGPMSYNVLSSAIQPSNLMMKEIEEDEEAKQWWKEYYSDEKLHYHEKQVAAWKQLSSTLHPSAKVVMPLTVRDPRVTLPAKKVPMEEEDPGNIKRPNLPEWPVDSPLFNSDFRDQVTLSKEPDAVINQRRSQFLVPGSQLPETQEEARLPLLLLSRPPTSAGLGSGWEVVAPAGWGMSVFLPLVFNGGVVNGQRGAENLHLEALTPFPPHLLPDTPAGDVYSAFLAAERHKEFFKRPPASRLNYIKLGVQFPFTHPWRKLLKEWQPGITDFFVLRDSKLISDLSCMVKSAREISDKVDEGEKLTDDLKNGSNSKQVEKIKGTGLLGCDKSADANTGNTTDRKRKADDDTNTNGTKVAKYEHKEEETHLDVKERNDTDTNETKTPKCKHSEEIPTDTKERKDDVNTSKMKIAKFEYMEETHMDITETNGSEETELTRELALVSPNCLVMVQLILAHKGTLEPCAMVCLPMKEDLIPDLLKKEQEIVREPLHEDPNHERRAKMREEHSKIMGRMRRVRRKARQKVAKEMDFTSPTHSNQNIKTATTEALRKVDKENEVILKKYLSYKEEMESAWLMSTSDPIQCCVRPIIGYITHGTFSYTHGKAAGIGWVGLKPLLRLIDLWREGGQGKVLEGSKRGKVTTSLPVLVRNPSTLQYRWAQLSVVESPPTDAQNDK